MFILRWAVFVDCVALVNVCLQCRPHSMLVNCAVARDATRYGILIHQVLDVLHDTSSALECFLEDSDTYLNAPQ